MQSLRTAFLVNNQTKRAFVTVVERTYGAGLRRFLSIRLSRVFNFAPTKAEQQMQVHNSNSFPVFAEIDYGKTAFGDGAYVALAPGETLAIWSWRPAYCVLWNGAAQCSGYQIARGSARVWTLKEGEPGSAH